jgi:hypothetical protein
MKSGPTADVVVRLRLTHNRHGVGGSVMRCSVVIYLDLPDAACGFRVTPPCATISASSEFIGKMPK